MPTTPTSGAVDADGDADVRVFMSYRRTDDANFTGRFHDKLIGIFGDANVFRDIDSIPAGTRFEDVITDRLSNVDAVVALIGPTWSARIDAPSDFVRMEIAHALERGTPVIPVIIEDTPLPPPDALPGDLQPLLDRQAVRVRRDPDFHRDAARVVDGLREAVNVQRVRAAELRRAAEAEAERKRAEDEVERARVARLRDLEAEVAAAEARAAEERRVAEALEAERAQRLIELARLEEEATQRRINDERARVAAITETQAHREREAATAEARAADLRRELDELSGGTSEPRHEIAPVVETIEHVTEPDVIDDVTEPDVIEPEAIEPDVIEPDVIDQAAAETAPIVMGPAAVEAVTDTDDLEPAIETERNEPTPTPVAPVAGRRSVSSASKGELIGAVLLIVGFVLSLRSMFMEQADGANAFSGPWATDIVGVILVLGLLAPYIAFQRDLHVPGVLAGAGAGFLAYQGLVDTPWFWYKDYPFPQHTIVIAAVLAAAWFAAYRGTTRPRARVVHTPSRILQIIAAAATLVTTMMYVDLLSDWNDPDPTIIWVFFAAAVAMVVLCPLRAEGTTVTLAVLALDSALFFIAIAIAHSDVRDRVTNIAIASAVLAGAATWRARHVSLVDDQKRPTAATSTSA